MSRLMKTAGAVLVPDLPKLPNRKMARELTAGGEWRPGVLVSAGPAKDHYKVSIFVLFPRALITYSDLAATMVGKYF